MQRNEFFDHLSESKNFFSNQIRAKNQSQFQQKGVPVDFEEVIFIIHALIKPDGISSLRNFDFITAIVLDLSSFCTHFISFWIIFTAACHVMWKSTTSFLGKRGQNFFRRPNEKFDQKYELDLCEVNFSMWPCALRERLAVPSHS